MPRVYNVLFLCTGNSARSILAEAILNQTRQAQFPCVQRRQPSDRAGQSLCDSNQLEDGRITHGGLRSKSWDEFAKPGAPQMDFVFTVCDNAAARSMSRVAGPAGDRALGRSRSRRGCGYREQIERAFRDAFVTLDRRIGLFLSLPLASLRSASPSKKKSTASAGSDDADQR